MPAQKGRCLCGAVAYEYTGPENWRAHCHCESCRRATSSPFTTYMGVPRGAFRWTGEAPASYASSPGVTRRFCPHCGSPMAYEAEKFAHEIHLFAATLENSADFKPQGHVFYAEHVPWAEPDDLPKYRTTGAGERLEGPLEEVREFVERYRATWEAVIRGDRPLEDLTAFFAQPCSMIGVDGAVTTTANAAETVAFNRSRLDAFRAGGCHSAHLLGCSTRPLGENAALAFVDWELRRTDGSVERAWRHIYTLRRTGGDVAILVSTFQPGA